MKLLSLFSGIGAFEKALKNLDISYDLLGYCEINKYASKAYSLIHKVDESLNFGDITKIDSTSISKPVDLDITITSKFLMQEIMVFHRTERERVFIVNIRQDIDSKIFEFPKPFELKLKLKDFADYDDEFIVPDHILNSFNRKGGDFGKRFKTQDGEKYSMCITTKPSWAVITNNYYTKDLKRYTIEEVVNKNITVYANSPKMNFNLMGFTDDDFKTLSEISNNQLYKLAGNSIVVDVAEEVLCQMFDENGNISV